jgi:RNA polymerase sigma-70 factor (ECF subfamily)
MPDRRSISSTGPISPLTPVRPPEYIADADLLDRFVRRKDEAAFAALLERHGPMVLGVCRRLLPDSHAADDAFQATFLIFLQKARSLRDPASLGNWLFGVAYRVARRARTVDARWRRNERQVLEMAATESSSDPLWHELRPMLDEEIARLPPKYQAPVVLCYLEGKTYSEAAHILGWAEGTVSGRLARARDKLRRRLALRGEALSGALLPGLLAQKGTEIVPPALAATIQKGALAVVTGQAAAVTFPIKVAALAQGTLQAFFISKLKVVVVVLTMICTFGGGAILVAHWMAGDQAARLLPPLHAWKDTFHRHLENLQGTWDLISLEKEGRPLSAEEVKKQGLVWIIEADQIVMQSNNKRSTAKYSVDPSGNPHTIDLVLASDPEQQEQTWRGIYARPNGTLQVCYDPVGELRPKKFETAAGRTVLLMVFKKRD